MPSKIEAHINKIRAIFGELRSGLVQEKDRSLSLEMELNKVNEALAQLKLQNTDLTQQVYAMKNAASTNPQVIVESRPELSQRKEEEIDALVKEIEFCIQQLKDKNA